jgi:hypothetical protein
MSPRVDMFNISKSSVDGGGRIIQELAGTSTVSLVTLLLGGLSKLQFNSVSSHVSEFHISDSCLSKDI